MMTLAKCLLKEELRGAGKCRHIVDGADVTNLVTYLHVAQLEGDTGYYVYYEDAFGNPLNDLSFDSIPELIQQVRTEFDCKTADDLLEQVSTNLQQRNA